MKYSKITFKSDFKLSYLFIGSTVRGVIGQALKKVVCINPKYECKGCFAIESCLYADMYEKEFNKFRLEFELGGRLEFSLYLFEELSGKVPYVLSSLYKAFKELGITRERIRIDDFKMYLNDELVYDGEFKEFKNEPFIFEFPSDYEEEITIKFLTPLRIKENNRYVRDDIKLKTLLRNINHRFLRLQNKKITKLEFTPRVEIINKDLVFKDFTRYSNRQKTKMKLGGLTGEIKAKVDENTYKYLKLGEIIGVGKQVTFGLGNIKVE